MTQQTNQQGRGGSTVVREDGTVEHTRGTLNPGESGYDEALRKAPLQSSILPGTLNRAPSHRDLEEIQRAASTQASVSRSAIDSAPADPAFKPNTKGDK